MQQFNTKKFVISEVKKIENHFLAKNYDEVIQRCIKILKKYPKITLLYNFLGAAYRQNNNGILAEKAFRQGLDVDPKNVRILSNLAALYRLSENYDLSEEFFKKAIQNGPNDTTVLCNYGNLMRDINKFDEAISLYLAALDINERLPIVLLNLSGIYQNVGKFDLSIKYTKKLLDMFPNITVADKLLSNLLEYQNDDSHQKVMLQKINDNNINDDDKIPLYFALAKAYEDQKNYKEAYSFIKKANDKQKDFLKYKIETTQKEFERIKNIFNNINLDYKTDDQNGDNLIFIVGLPRSGTTLTHQIIGAHEKTYGAGELGLLSRLLQNKLHNDAFIKNFILNREIKFNSTKEVSKEYIKRLESYYKSEKIIIDKSPLNFRWIGFIKILFPKAKVIHCTRNVKDNLLSIYKNVFDGGSIPWSYNLEDLATFNNLYKNLMSFWEEKIPNFIYTSNYEMLIKDQENQSKKLIDFCGLEWDSSCLDYHKQNNAIKTVSITQARKPIYNTSVNSNEKFPELAKFFESL